jgi:capsid protein
MGIADQVARLENIQKHQEAQLVDARMALAGMCAVIEIIDCEPFLKNLAEKAKAEVLVPSLYPEQP